jgi:DNA-binding NarL/FixJ family response regulator
MKNKLQILIAEDHQTVREAIKLIIDSQEDMTVIGEAGNGHIAVKLAQELKPEVILMDISMPELNGLTATLKLKQIDLDIKILVLTRHTDEAYLRELLAAGVSGYVLKQSHSTELLRAIRAVASGGQYLDPAIGNVMSSYPEKQAQGRGETRGAQLSNREQEVLRSIALGYSNHEIAERLNVTVKTVEAHKANALRKLGMHSRKDIMSYAILQGWLEEN